MKKKGKEMGYLFTFITAAKGAELFASISELRKTSVARFSLLK